MVTYSFKVGNQEFQSLETKIFFAIGTYGSTVGNQEFQSLGTGISLQ